MDGRTAPRDGSGRDFAPRSVTWVTTELAREPRSGGAIRARRLLGALAGEWPVDVVLLARCDDDDSLRAAVGARSLRSVRSGASAVAKRRDAVRYRWPLQVAQSWAPEAAEIVRALSGPSVVTVLERLPSAPHRADSPTVLSLHDVEADLALDLPWDGGPRRRLEGLWDRMAWPRFESLSVSDPSTSVVVPSFEDGSKLGRRCEIVPNGADIPEAVTPVPRQGALLYVGSMHYRPNALAIEWWVEQVAPLLGSNVPRLSVVGRSSERVLAHLRNDVTLIGEVPDVGPHLSGASVVVVPLRHGSGTRLKILEAMAWGRPVVATSKGAEGLGIVAGEHALIADRPADFAACVERVHSDHDLATRLAQAGRRLAEGHSWMRSGAQFADVVAAAPARWRATTGTC